MNISHRLSKYSLLVLAKQYTGELFSMRHIFTQLDNQFSTKQLANHIQDKVQQFLRNKIYHVATDMNQQQMFINMHQHLLQMLKKHYSTTSWYD